MFSTCRVKHLFPFFLFPGSAGSAWEHTASEAPASHAGGAGGSLRGMAFPGGAWEREACNCSRLVDSLAVLRHVLGGIAGVDHQRRMLDNEIPIVR